MTVAPKQIYQHTRMLAISTESVAVRLIHLSNIMEKKNKVRTLILQELVIYSEIFFLLSS